MDGHIDKYKHGHCDAMTDPAQRAESVNKKSSVTLDSYESDVLFRRYHKNCNFLSFLRQGH